MTPSNLINWGELSRLLAGHRSSITKKRIPKCQEKKIAALIAAIEKWKEAYLE
jgi:hypothetical protein